MALRRGLRGQLVYSLEGKCRFMTTLDLIHDLRLFILYLLLLQVPEMEQFDICQV